jgi:hypothetical protein
MVKMGGRWRLTITKFGNGEMEGRIVHLRRYYMARVEGSVEGGQIGLEVRKRISWRVEGRRRVWRHGHDLREL